MRQRIGSRQGHQLAPFGKTRVAVAVLLIGLVIVGTFSWVRTFGLPGGVPRLVGTGGYAPHVVSDVPRPFSFDAPRVWRYWAWSAGTPPARTIQLQGPSDNLGVRFVALEIKVAPNNKSGGEYSSLEQFADVFLPSKQIEKRQAIKEASSAIAGLEALDITHTYMFIGVPPRGVQVPSRGRAVLFEDRGYFYMLEYSAPEADYDQYSEVFDRAVASFKFLD